MASLNSKDLLQHYQEGQSEAARLLFDKYAKRLLALARKRISPRLKQRFDAEDVVQSAYRSFFVHAKNEAYQLERSGDLWRLLASITLHKLFGQIEKHTAAKRNLDKEQPIDLFTSTVPEPTPSEVVALVEELESVIHSLLPSERLVVTGKLQGQELSELAVSINKSERTVRRLLASAKRKMELRLLQTDSAIQVARLIGDHEAPLQYSEFVLEELIGSGGMGKVFRASVKPTGETVAIKALHKARQKDLRAVVRFVQESQVLSTLHHPHIVGVRGLGRFPGGGYFMVMEFIDGEDLQSRLEKEIVSIQEALSIVRDVASAVGYAHENGIIHCDLKPANILLRNDGKVLVTDFGFAFLVQNSASSQEPDSKQRRQHGRGGNTNVSESPDRVLKLLLGNSVGGTAGYIAPEVCSGREYPTTASDIYSLGVLLSVLVTGEFHAKAKRVDFSNETWAPIEALIKRCLNVVPNKRIQTTSELNREIVSCLNQLEKNGDA